MASESARKIARTIVATSCSPRVTDSARENLVDGIAQALDDEYNRGDKDGYNRGIDEASKIPLTLDMGFYSVTENCLFSISQDIRKLRREEK